MENILIADDHEIVRRGLRMIIEAFSRKYNFIEASTCKETMQILSKQEVHFAILDMFQEDGNIFSVIQRDSEYRYPTSILIYSMNAEKIYARRLIQRGIKGFVSKQAGIAELEKAIRIFLDGGVYLSTSLQMALIGLADPESVQNPVDALSDRELEVVEYLVMGLGAKEIAGKMNLDITTVSTYRRRAFEKLHAENAIELKDIFLSYKMRYR